MKEPVIGLCPLCLQQRQLEKSHYFGRALHLLSQDDGEAVFMTPHRIELSGRQIWEHLLCGECEDILAKNESYAHQWINRKGCFLGDDLPGELLEACCVGSARKVIFMRDCAADVQHAFGHLYQTADIDSPVTTGGPVPSKALP